MKIRLSRRNWEQRMDDELRFHLDQQIRDYMESGLSRAEAERRARQEFGTLSPRTSVATSAPPNG